MTLGQSICAPQLEDVKWNITEAAQRLDLTRAHVYNLIRLFGLSRNGR